MIIFSTVSGHIESIAVLSKVMESEDKKIAGGTSEESVLKNRDFQCVY